MRASPLPLVVVAALGVLSSIPPAPALAIPPHERRTLPQLAADSLKAFSLRLKLLDELGADALGIRVSVRGDHVLLSGSVSRKSSQELAREVALSAEGVRSVDSRVFETRPAGGLVDAAGEVRDAALESRVKVALLREFGSTALGIEVEATDGVVSLRGTVADPDVLKACVERARSVPGVRKVVDLLRA